MATNLNLDSLVVDSSGRASFSGLRSGIDIHGTVDALISAKRIPIDTIERRLSANEAKIAAFDELGSLTRALRDAADGLRGMVSFDQAGDAFAGKQAFAVSSRSDAAPASSAAELMGVTVNNRAQATSHKLEILQLARAHKAASDSIASTVDDPLGQAGSFAINGRSITVGSADSLLDLRDKINAANSGSNATGVTASIVSLASDSQVLMLSADATGTAAAMTLADDGGSVLADLGLLEGGAIKHELQAAANAIIAIDGLATPIERASNTIDDVISGMTLSLFKAEAGTTVDLSVERDLNQAKAAIVDFVDAYNELRSFINAQAQFETENEDGELVAGELAGASALSDVRARLAAVIGNSVQGADAALRVLAEIGIDIQGAGQVGDPLLANTLSIDESKLDDALLREPDAVRALFGFGYASASSDVMLAGFSGTTGFQQGGYTLNVAYADGQVVSANIDGAADGSDDGSIAVNGKILTVTSGQAEGLQMLFSGAAPASGIQLDLSIGIAAQLHGATGSLTDDSGLIANEIGSLEAQNSFAQSRVTSLNERLERERERLLEKYVAMETALARMNTLLDSVRQQLEAAFGDRS